MQRYQNSECRPGWLHKYRPIRETNKGILERCERCGKNLHIPHGMPNHVYLSHHIRDILQTNEPRFNREYPQHA